MKPTDWNQFEDEEKRKYATKLVQSARGQYLMSEALTFASAAARNASNVSNADDYDLIREALFPVDLTEGRRVSVPMSSIEKRSDKTLTHTVDIQMPRLSMEEAQTAVEAAHMVLSKLGMVNDDILRVWNHLNLMTTRRAVAGELRSPNEYAVELTVELSVPSAKELDDIRFQHAELLDRYYANDVTIDVLNAAAALYFAHGIAATGKQVPLDTRESGDMSSLLSWPSS